LDIWGNFILPAASKPVVKRYPKQSHLPSEVIMLSYARRAVFGLLFLFVTSPVAAQEPVELHGKLDAVTVYRGQALVTRLIEVPAPAGLREVIVTNLPAGIVPGSIYAESADGVEVRSVRFRTRAVSEDVREEVRAIDQQIQRTQDDLNASQRQTALLAEQKAYLDKLEQFTAPTATVELSKGVLNAETLKEMTVFLFQQRRDVATQELELALEQRDLQAQLELLKRKRQELTGGSARTEREAVVFVNLQGDGGQMRVRYLVNNATWSPSYNVRASAGEPSLTVEYNASIEQMSGEDWSDVRMTLSTATPSLVARAPELSPLRITLAAAAAVIGRDLYIQNTKELASRRAQVEAQRQMDGSALGVAGPGAAAGDDKDLNRIADELQVLELLAREARRDGRGEGPSLEQSLSVTYELPGRTSLPSRSDRQIIQVASLPMQATFYKLAIPVLTHYVYDEAEVVNSGGMVLLAGPVASYFEGQFVGHGHLPTVAAGQQFTIGFGIDSSLRAERELMDKTESVQGGNRMANFSYRLTIENFGEQAARVRLLDRLPVAKESEVKLTVVSVSQEPVKPVNEQTDRKTGLLRWDVEVAPRATAEAALAVDYAVRMEYDRNLSIAELPAE
jgi:hypothetical protein